MNSISGGDPCPTIAIGSLGAIGSTVAAGIAASPHIGRLVAVSCRDGDKARARLATMGIDAAIVPPEALADAADVVVECAPAGVFSQIAGPAIAAGRVLVPATVSGLLAHPELIDAAKQSGARILVPTGAIAGLDAVRALARSAIESASLTTRKSPKSLAGAPHLADTDFDPAAIAAPVRVFDGDTFAAATAFPANVNVAAALALAGCGPERTRVEIWADPDVTVNTHRIQVKGDAGTLDLTICVFPSQDNPRSSSLTPLSILDVLESLTTTLRVGS